MLQCKARTVFCGWPRVWSYGTTYNLSHTYYVRRYLTIRNEKLPHTEKSEVSSPSSIDFLKRILSHLKLRHNICSNNVLRNTYTLYKERYILLSYVNSCFSTEILLQHVILFLFVYL
jgi:hypothetical protein